MTDRHRLALLVGWLTLIVPLGAATSDNPPPGVSPPVSQVLFVQADHSAWTRFDRDGNQPLTLTVVGPDLVLAGFSGGYLLLKADLSLLPVSLNFLGRPEAILKNASPWAAAWTDQTAVLLDNRAQTMALVYPEEGLVFTQEQKLPDISHFNAVPGKRIALYQSRKAWTMDIWPR
ncbi:MAG: hypothetical protein PHV85_10835, partial [Desulfovibrionaceae bacterium]|nr:hypothetical protein [Desulfovibrionaceae bacterium]